MSSADSILLAAINNKIDFFEINSLSDLEDISNGCLFTLLQSFLDPQISEKVEVSFFKKLFDRNFQAWNEKFIVENRAADEFRAAPSEGAAFAFRFDQS